MPKVPLEFPSDDSNPLIDALGKEPSSRDGSQVRLALEWWLLSLGRISSDWKEAGQDLLYAFLKGKLVHIQKGQQLQQEGDEVRHYTILLSGRCRLRCRQTAVKGTTATASQKTKADLEVDDVSESLGGDAGFVTFETIGRGEFLGLFPGDQRSPFDVIANEKSLVLQLNLEDYTATLKPWHRSLQAQAADFLHTNNVFPTALPQHIQRLSQLLRQRTYRRGRLLLSANEAQRSIWILRTGLCQVFASSQVKPEGIAEGNEDRNALNEEEEYEQRLQHLRSTWSAKGTNALEESQRASVSKYARGSIKTKLTTGELNPSSDVQAGPAACICDPGTLLGEEILLLDGFQSQLAARSVITVKVEAESSFYYVDPTAFRVLAQCLGSDYLAESVSERYSRRAGQLGRALVAKKSLETSQRRLQRREHERLERQKIRLPVSGPLDVTELENVNDWLGVVLEHRRPPPDHKNSANTLACLETVGMTTASGPGVDAMKKIFADKAALKEYRVQLQRWKTGTTRRKVLTSSSNPMGETAPNARYADTALPDASVVVHEPLMLTEDSMCEPSGFSSFFQTEPDIVSYPAHPVSSQSTRSVNQISYPSPSALADSTRSSQRDSHPPAPPVSRASSVPVLPRLHPAEEEKEALTGIEARKSVSTQHMSSVSSVKGSQQRIMKSFHRAVAGKSLLVLTDKADVRKSVMRSLMSAAPEMSVCFVRNPSELWTRLRDTKEIHHGLIVDLGKSDLQMESLVKTIRANDRYTDLSIVVLSHERELSDIVQSMCSYVVYHPISASVFREALLWCFDRKALIPKAVLEGSKMETLISQTSLKPYDEVSSLSIIASSIEVR